IIQLLLKKSASINALSPNGTTPLMMAAGYGGPDSVALLLQAKADTNLKNEAGLTALDFARRANNDKDTDEGWMRVALQQAKLGLEQAEVPVGAVVVYENRLIASAYNSPITNHDPCAHAEISALRAAANALGNYRLPHCTLYVTLEPCVMCVGAVVQARIQRLVFGAYEPKTGAVNSLFTLLDNPLFNHHTRAVGGVLQEESKALLQQFFKQQRSKHKTVKKNQTPST
ncbi:unnamed protein product, partial [Darwinula stevensoni]